MKQLPPIIRLGNYIRILLFKQSCCCRIRKGDYDAAIATCERAIDEGRDMRADYKLIAKSFARLGNIYLKKMNYPKQ